VQAQEHFAPDDAPLRNVIPVSPLSVELKSAPWPCRFNANTLPQYDGDYEPKEFLMKYEAQWSPTEVMPQRRQRLLCWPLTERFSIGMQTYRRGT
jgi:hypothetical protein